MKLTDKQRNVLRLISDAILSFALVVTGILFIYSCYTIYKSGPSPFTRESIAAAFSKIDIAVYITLLIVVAAAVVDIIISAEQKKLVGARSPKIMVKRLSERADLENADKDIVARIEKERRLRKILDRVRLGINLACLFLPLIYLLNPANFPAADANAEVIRAILIYIALISPAIVFEIVHIILSDASYVREAELLKAAPKTAAKIEENAQHTSKLDTVKAFFSRNEKEIALGLRIAVVICALVFVAIGIFSGGMTDVLNKAIKICTECIGLG